MSGPMDIFNCTTPRLLRHWLHWISLNWQYLNAITRDINTFRIAHVSKCKPAFNSDDHSLRVLALSSFLIRCAQSGSCNWNIVVIRFYVHELIRWLLPRTQSMSDFAVFREWISFIFQVKLKHKSMIRASIQTQDIDKTNFCIHHWKSRLNTSSIAYFVY
jgi:hypothetical protein